MLSELWQNETLARPCGESLSPSITSIPSSCFLVGWSAQCDHPRGTDFHLSFVSPSGQAQSGAGNQGRKSRRKYCWFSLNTEVHYRRRVGCAGGPAQSARLLWRVVGEGRDVMFVGGPTEYMRQIDAILHLSRQLGGIDEMHCSRSAAMNPLFAGG